MIAMNRQMLSRCAKALVECMNVQEEDAVLLGGGEHALDLLDQARTEISRKGAEHNLYFLTDNYGRVLFHDVNLEIHI